MNIPGLELDKIVDNIVNIKHSDMLNQIEDPEERAAKRKELVDYYTNGDAGEGLQREMDNVADGAQIVTDVISSLQQAVTAVLPPGTTPQVLVVGQATGSPNPAWGKLFSAAIKPGLLASCSLAEYVLKKVNASCQSISFDPPAVITALEVQLKSVKGQIDGL